MTSGKRATVGRRSPARLPEALYGRVRQILESARTSAARSVNTAQVVANWMVGREIVEEEQQGRERAGYAEGLVATLSERLSGDYGAGYSAQNLWYMRQFYLAYPELTSARKILHAVRGELTGSPQKRVKRTGSGVGEILHAIRRMPGNRSSTTGFHPPTRATWRSICLGASRLACSRCRSSSPTPNESWP